MRYSDYITTTKQIQWYTKKENQMSLTQLETALTNQTLASWQRNRSSNELFSLISRREAVLATVESDELADIV